LKYLESKERKNHLNIDISLKNNKHFFDNVIENISREHVNNISKNNYYII
jgi:uncharacterized protein YifN (PemK superfamily)